MSENSAAYALVPDLITHLAPHYHRIIPVHFWWTREGARTACESMASKPVRVLAAYARRPKVIHAEDERILIKINSLLFTGARAGAAFGIPVLAGVPLVSSLADFSVGVPCSWFHLAPIEQADTELQLSLSQHSALPCSERGISGPLTPEDIAGIAASQCRELEWMHAAEGMRSVKEQEGRYAGLFGTVYRPFFLVMTSRNKDDPTTA